ncbi:FAD-binding oxidoreductase [Candidatus Saccharibacteria bacterium]|nr:FAD-binding oxidoreductase [Candidatus Saccharibacteria bacterium]
MGKVARYLNQLTIGNVFDTPDVTEAYATDRSVLKIKPKLVALPELTDDVRKLTRFCYQLATKGIKIPITVRGSGLDEMGADLGNGLILSTEKLNRLLESDHRERLVRVQAGITLKELNTALSVNGLTIPVMDHEMETIGGLISNAPVDPISSKYGGIRRYVERIEVVLPNGDILQSDQLSLRAAEKKAAAKTLEGTIYRKMLDIVKKNGNVMAELRKNTHAKYGYSNASRMNYGKYFDLMPLFFGAQGTLGVITEVILKAVPIEKTPKRMVATFTDFDGTHKFLDEVNKLKPRRLELYDINIIRAAEETGKRLSEVTSKMRSGFVVFADFDSHAKSCLRKVHGLSKNLPNSSRVIIESPATEATLNEFENSLVSFLNCTRSGERPPILTDFYVPERNLSSFINDVVVLGNGLGLDLAVYGSYVTSNYHLRPKFDVEDPEFNKKATAFLKAGAFVVKRQGGSITGGAPEGRVKAMVTNDELTALEKKLYAGIKSTFDRYEIMNPSVKIGADARFTVRHFRNEATKTML